MPVIGKLDDQVNEVLISPLDKTGQRETATRTAQQPNESSGDKPPTPSSDPEQVRTQTEKEELPVWLL